jgi:hypothetical protein
LQFEGTKEKINELLPKVSSGPGDFPLIKRNVVITLIELAYSV